MNRSSPHISSDSCWSHLLWISDRWISSAPIYFYSYDELGTFIIGGSDLNPAFRGFIRQMDFYRRIAFTYEQVRLDFDHRHRLFECFHSIHLSYRRGQISRSSRHFHRSSTDPTNAVTLTISSNRASNNINDSINTSERSVSISRCSAAHENFYVPFTNSNMSCTTIPTQETDYSMSSDSDVEGATALQIDQRRSLSSVSCVASKIDELNDGCSH